MKRDNKIVSNQVLFDGWHFWWMGGRYAPLSLSIEQLVGRLKKEGVKNRDIPRCIEQIKARRISRMPIRGPLQAISHRRAVSFFE